jgi:hypothetical protein
MAHDPVCDGTTTHWSVQKQIAANRRRLRASNAQRAFAPADAETEQALAPKETGGVAGSLGR